MENNVNIVITNPQPEARGCEGNYLTGIWLFLWIVLIIVFVLFFITRKDANDYPVSKGISNSLINGVQTTINQDKIYITNANTGFVSIIDTKTDQMKSILPFQ